MTSLSLHNPSPSSVCIKSGDLTHELSKLNSLSLSRIWTLKYKYTHQLAVALNLDHASQRKKDVLAFFVLFVMTS